MTLKSSIINILDKGFKFIPNFNLKPFHIFYNIINTLEDEMFNLNKQFFIKNQSLNRPTNNIISPNEVIAIERDDIVNIESSNESSFLDENFSQNSLENFLDFKQKLNRKNKFKKYFTFKRLYFLSIRTF